MKRSRTQSSQDGLSERRLKTYKVSEEHLEISVGLTGARAGDILHGLASSSSGDTANVVLRLDSGLVCAPAIIRRSIEAEVGKDKLIASIARHFSCSKASAELRLNDFPTTEQPNHQPLGSGCSHGIDENCSCEPAARFTILSQGKWQEFADAHGHGEELQRMVEERRSVCWRDVLRLMCTPGEPEGKKLVLRPRLFAIQTGPSRVAANDKRLQNTDGSEAQVIDAMLAVGMENDDKDEAVVYDVDGYLIRLPTCDSAKPFVINEIADAVVVALKDLIPPEELRIERVKECIDLLKPLTGGGLKSCMQKVVRFGPAAVDVGHTPPFPAALVAAIAAGLLFADKGSFQPELQIFTRGCTAAFKRLAVILEEDCWVAAEGERTEQNILALCALAFVTQRMVDYHPTRSLINGTLRLVAQGTLSPLLVAWRDGDRKTMKLASTASGCKKLSTAAKLLRIVRSFNGDMDMFDSVAAMSQQHGGLWVTEAKQIPKTMPICHLVDQHCYRGIAHILSCASGGGNSFSERFRMVFDSCTGVNPRRQNVDGFESREIVQAVRFAQECIAMFALKKARSSLETASATNGEVKLPLDSGVLAAGVGPISVRISRGKDGRKAKEVLVMLGVRTPDDEVVMLKPARATRDLFGSLSQEERQEAISLARSLKDLPVQSPLLPRARKASFQNGVWCLDGEDWKLVQQRGHNISVPIVASPTWVSKDISGVMKDDEVLREALSVTGKGIVAKAEELIVALTASAKHSVALRAVSLLRQQYSVIALPTPSLDGGLGSDQLAAYAEDWDAYRLLALVSRLAPGALRPAMPPNFQVVDAVLLRVVEQWMMLGVSQISESCSRSRCSGWENRPEWKEMVGADSKLMEHQRAAVARMHQRDAEADTGHFLIMDTGMGKTFTSLCYGYRWLCTHGQMVKRVIWITPAETVNDLIEQLQSTWSAPVFRVPRISCAKKAKMGETMELVLKDYHINVIHADHLRTLIDKGLAEEAPFSFLIFDEVDEMYAPTLRTSAARRLCQLCRKFVAQTATPMRKNESQLLAWLSDTCSFPVDSRNMLVAASGMVSIQLELGIVAHEEDVLVPMADAVRSGCHELLQSRSWLKMARLVQEHTDKAMVDKAVELSRKDRASYKNGGVLLIADTAAHAHRLIDMCSSHILTGDFASLEAANASNYGIVVVTKDKDRGYNSAVRLGHMVTGAYAGNGASRHQIRGRLRRLGQVRKAVSFVTVVMEHSLLHLLHQRHSTVDCMNISLEQLGMKFEADVLKGLNTPGGGAAFKQNQAPRRWMNLNKSQCPEPMSLE
eukprot:gnl/MRDRNA2_/MRDRNA2_115939_c0_seq1.p1 gnl/MRDRNA2_/MRDRNA2_115939_c0~~gnl/MRDRNA2_/MRDRNA2_115939_c0_seq1.p1  ORF type:complete len:1300 (-),score=258.95 gnl/MRDRNA2_/MRDRNA2_115939_c0_seq1:153-4052(-)